MSTKAKSAKAVPERLRELYRPGVLEKGLKIIAKEQDEAAAKKDALWPCSSSNGKPIPFPARPLAGRQFGGLFGKPTG
jgi:hypothetical protein